MDLTKAYHNPKLNYGLVLIICLTWTKLCCNRSHPNEVFSDRTVAGHWGFSTHCIIDISSSSNANRGSCSSQTGRTATDQFVHQCPLLSVHECWPFAFSAFNGMHPMQAQSLWASMEITREFTLLLVYIGFFFFGKKNMSCQLPKQVLAVDLPIDW